MVETIKTDRSRRRMMAAACKIEATRNNKHRKPAG
jgi:hypothetical protein